VIGQLTSPLYFIIFFRGFGLVLAVTGKWFSLLCFSILRFDSGHRRLSSCVPEWGRQ